MTTRRSCFIVPLSAFVACALLMGGCPMEMTVPEPGGQSTPTGPAGPKGDTGLTGPPGADGLPGAPGPAGVSPFSFTTPPGPGDIFYDDGNVGVGTATPLARLHVDSSNVAPALLDSNNTLGTMLALRNTSTGGTAWQFLSTGSDVSAGAGHLMIGHSANFGVFANSALFINGTTGNVGIGTNTPDVHLHIGLGSDVSLAGGGYLLVGDTGGQNIAVDDDEIMARNGGGTSTLRLNAQGGRVTIGGQDAVTGSETIRVVRGTVSSVAMVVRGAGWSVARTAGQATGDYTITFFTAFSDAPSVSATAFDSTVLQIAVAAANTATTTRIRTFNTAGALVNTDFDFIAAGPR